jgi:hypothetical protein
MTLRNGKNRPKPEKALAPQYAARGWPAAVQHRSLPAVEPTKGSDVQLTQRLAKLGETDTDNAQRFAERFGTKVIHTPGRGWLLFDGKRWRSDTLLRDRIGQGDRPAHRQRGSAPA